MTTPKRKSIKDLDVRSLARAHTTEVVQMLAGIARSGTSEQARVSAGGMLLDRGWGKPAQPVTGKDGAEDIQVTIRTIIEGSKK